MPSILWQKAIRSSTGSSLSCWTCLDDCQEKVRALLTPLISVTETDIPNRRTTPLGRSWLQWGLVSQE
jgi:hypothetical protein